MNGRFFVQLAILILAGLLILRLFPFLFRAVEMAAMSLGQFWWAILLVLLLIVLILFLRARRRK